MAFQTADIELQASATNTAAGTTTSNWVDISASGGGVVSALITNGGTGPTLPCEFHLDVSPDNGSTVYPDFAVGSAGTANSAAYPFHATVPPGVRYVRSRFTGNTAQNVTVQADLQKLVKV